MMKPRELGVAVASSRRHAEEVRRDPDMIVWFGAVTTSVLFTLGKSILGLYLGRAGVGSAYSAAGSLVVLTVWVSYASMIVFFGAEVTYLRSRYSR